MILRAGLVGTLLVGQVAFLEAKPAGGAGPTGGGCAGLREEAKASPAALPPVSQPGGPVECSVSGKPTLAVLDLAISGFSSDEAGLFNEALRSELVSLGCFRVQDRAQMKEILKTQAVNASEACDESCAVEAGRLLQVRLLASGRVTKSTTGAWAIATLTDVESGTVVKSVRVKASAATDDGVMEILPGVARQLSGSAPPPLPAVPPPEPERKNKF